MKLNIQHQLINHQDDYLFNLLNIENFNKETSYLRHFFKHLIKNQKKIKGDIYEFGTFNGRSALSIAILLKKIKSKKKIYCFDSFSGFPSYHKYDQLKFLKKNKKIYKKHLFNKLIRNFDLKKKISVKNISSSFDFSGGSLSLLKKKINLLKLDNIHLIVGKFEETLPRFFNNKKVKIFSANLDCDLYESYKICLPHVYDNLQHNGYVHLDEYYSLKFPGPKIACDEFAKNRKFNIKKNKSFKWEFERYCIIKK